MKQETLLPSNFNSPTHGSLVWDQAVVRMIKFMAADVTGKYELIIGTDSEAVNGTSDFVSAIVVHKMGRGGIYFWGRQKVKNLNSLRQRIWHEALVSLELAQKVTEEFNSRGLFDLNLGIHVDIGPNGETKTMINEIVGMIRANGFSVSTKPSSWGASTVADRHV